MVRIRRDAVALGPGWNSTLEWYAKAIREMDARPITDRTSFKYFAAIHGFTMATWVNRGIITPSDSLPPAAERRRIFSQCQHSGWYFLPWHRGYLAAFEKVVAATVMSLGGPNDWALPYWNYFDVSNPNARNLPQAFTNPSLPDGTTNPLATPPRWSTRIGPVPWHTSDIDLDCMSETQFTAARGTSSFGGGQTGFVHFGSVPGELELDPHNKVHVIIGGGPTLSGANPSIRLEGYMFDPDLAGLDPIFWLHHCNIDRLWAAWMSRPGNTQTNDPAWMNGPSPRQFEMPTPNGSLSVFTPGQTLPGGPLAPTYDDLIVGTNIPAPTITPAPPLNPIPPTSPTPIVPGGPGDVDGGVGSDVPSGSMPASFSSSPPSAAILKGASAVAVSIGREAQDILVAIENNLESLAADSVGKRVFLNLENVTGEASSTTLNISVGLPATETSPGTVKEFVKSVALFGLKKASDSEGEHAGSGITVAVEITDLVSRLNEISDTNIENLVVGVEQSIFHGEEPDVNVQKISIFNQDIEA